MAKCCQVKDRCRVFLNLNLMCAVFNNTICFCFFLFNKFFFDKSNPFLDFSIPSK